MFHVGHDLTHLLATYGYGAVLLFVAIESIGIPFPGETMLLAAAIYAGTTHHLQIALVIGAAALRALAWPHPPHYAPYAPHGCNRRRGSPPARLHWGRILTDHSRK